MLEPVNHKAFQTLCVQDLIFVNEKLVKRMYALDFAEQNKRIQVIMAKYQFLELCKLPQLVKVWMVHY